MPPASDTSNYLGGVGDAFEDKGHRGAQTDHPVALAGVALCSNYRQLADVRCGRCRGDHDGYTVRLWPL